MVQKDYNYHKIPSAALPASGFMGINLSTSTQLAEQHPYLFSWQI